MPGPTRLLATMVTTTTYGTWLPGDARGYVDAGRVLPSDPFLESKSRRLMEGEAVFLSEEEQSIAFEALIAACVEFDYTLVAVTIETWHAHLLLTHGRDDVAKVAGRLKNRMRQAIDRGRVWTKGYDKRFCYTEADVMHRQEYITRHRGHRPLPPR